MSNIKITSLVNYRPTVREQGSSPTCAAESIAAILEYAYYNKYKKTMFFSRDSIFGNPKLNNGDDGSGMPTLHALKMCSQYSGVPESELPSIHNGTAEEIMENFKKHNNLQFERRTQLFTLKNTHTFNPSEGVQLVEQAINNPDKFGLPLIAIKVWSSFYEGRVNPVLKQVDKNKETDSGGHGMVVVGTGEIDGKPYLIVQNSWGESWGQDGLCFMPFDYNAIIQIHFPLISLREFGEDKSKIDERYFKDVMPEAALLSGDKVNKSIYIKEVTPIKDIEFNQLTYAESYPTIKEVEIRDYKNDTVYLSNDVVNKGNLTHIKFNNLIKFKQDVGYEVKIVGANNIVKIHSRENQISEMPPFKDTVFYRGFSEPVDIIQGFQDTTRGDIVKEFKIDMIEKTEDGFVKKNPTTVISAVEGLEDILENLDGGAGGLISSVNGKVGKVKLDASDIPVDNINPSYLISNALNDKASVNDIPKKLSQLENDLDIGTGDFEVEVIENGDPNDIKGSGVYFLMDTWENVPVYPIYAYLVHFDVNENDLYSREVMQILFDTESNKQYIRYFVNREWGEWRELLGNSGGADKVLSVNDQTGHVTLLAHDIEYTPGTSIYKEIGSKAAQDDLNKLEEKVDSLDSGSSGGSSSPRSDTIVVASENSSSKSKSNADYVLQGYSTVYTINDLIKSLSTTGGTIKFLEGSYTLEDTLELNTPNVKLEGVGSSTVLKQGTTTKTLITTSNLPEDSIVEISSIRIVGRDITGLTPMLRLTQNSIIRDCFIEDSQRVGILAYDNVQIISCSISNCKNHGVSLNDSARIVNSKVFRNHGRGIVLDGASVCKCCLVEYNRSGGIYSGSSHSKIIHTEVGINIDYGIKLDTTFEGVVAHNILDGGVLDDSSKNGIVEYNVIV